MKEIIEKAYYRFKLNSTTFVREAFWTLASMVELASGINLEDLFGNITGVSSSINSNSENTLATSKAIYDLNLKSNYYLKGILKAGESRVVFSSERCMLTEDSIIEIYNNRDGVFATSREFAIGKTNNDNSELKEGECAIILTYEPQPVDMNIRVKVVNE